MKEQESTLEQEILLAVNQRLYEEKAISEAVYTYAKRQIIKGRIPHPT